MIFVDTHVLFWLHDGNGGRLSAAAKKAIAHSPLLYSPMVRLELAYLWQVGKLGVTVDAFFEKLHRIVALNLTHSSFADICEEAEKILWTRDAFDRLIVAEASLHGLPLVSADRGIRKHYCKAVW